MNSSQGDPQTFAIIGAAMEVHRILKRGFVEAIYKDALAVEFTSLNIPFEREFALPVFYKGGRLPTVHRVDFFCYGDVLVEVKAVERNAEAEDAQVINYLRASGAARALILNFAGDSLGYKRYINTPGHPKKIRVDLRKSAVKKSRLPLQEKKDRWKTPPGPLA